MHAALFAAFTIDLPFAHRPRPAPAQAAIKATVVDTAAVEREVERIEQAERAEVDKREREAREAEAAADKARREREAEEQRLEQAKRDREEAEREEQRRQIALKEQKEREAKEQREREQAEARERERLAEEKRQREAEERKRKEAEEKQRLQAEAEARKQAEVEAELQRALAAEDERREAEEAGLLDQYIRLIQNKIERSWIKPPSAKPGLECVINVTQIPSGDVVGVGFGRCNADEAVKRSIEAAVLRASPLPKPPVPSLFNRSLEITFRPEV